MKVEAGRYYQNAQGLVRKVERFDTRVKSWGTWEEVVYRPVSANGAEGNERSCAMSTMTGWARSEFDPDSTKFSVKVKRVRPDAVLPTYATVGAAAFDLYAAESGVVGPGQVAKIPLGLAFEIPPGYVLIVAMRSGIAFKTALRQPNGIGVIDSDYRGEVAMLFEHVGVPEEEEFGRQLLTLDGGMQSWDIGMEYEAGSYLIRKGDRVAQGFVIAAPAVTFAEVDELSETERGTGGFGHTGVSA